MTRAQVDIKNSMPSLLITQPHKTVTTIQSYGKVEISRTIWIDLYRNQWLMQARMMPFFTKCFTYVNILKTTYMCVYNYVIAKYVHLCIYKYILIIIPISVYIKNCPAGKYVVWKGIPFISQPFSIQESIMSNSWHNFYR